MGSIYGYATLPEQFNDIYQLWKNGAITGRQAADQLGMPASTFLYKAKRYKLSIPETHQQELICDPQ